MKRIALLAAPDFEDMELMYPRYRLEEAGYKPIVIGKDKIPLQGKKGYPVTPDMDLSQAQAQEFEAVIIPGGWAPDHMRRDVRFIQFVKEIAAQKKGVAAICHAGWVLASAELVKGKTVTSFFAIRDDLIHAGAEWVDEEVVVDENLITSRTPKDLPAFMKAVLKFLAE